VWVRINGNTPVVKSAMAMGILRDNPPDRSIIRTAGNLKAERIANLETAAEIRDQGRILSF
jgi:hypothetical protein